MTYLNAIRYSDSPDIDAMERLRVSQPAEVFTSKQIHNNEPLFFDESEESGSGGSFSHSTDRAGTTLTSTASTATTLTRQTFRRFHYQPGMSYQLIMDVLLDKSGGGTGCERRIGLFDDSDGLFLEDNAGTYGFTRRTSVTGSPVDNTVTQENWNIDTLDGNGPSGETIDFTKIQKMVIEFGWSASRIRCGFVIGGRIDYAHEFMTNNTLDAPWASTPNLPMRIQMVTTASSPASTMEHFTSSLMAYGGARDEQIGVNFAVTTDGTHVDCNTENTDYAIIGLRLRADYLGSHINVSHIHLAEHQGSKDMIWKMLWNPTIAGSPTWADIPNTSLQRFLGATANTVTGGTLIATGTFSSSQKGGADGEELDSSLRLGAAIDGTRDVIVLTARPVGGSINADVEGAIEWREDS